MADFELTIWDNARLYMVDFARAPLKPPKTHPHRACPDIDRYGYMDDANGTEHGPIVSCAVGQPRVNVLFLRAEIATSARLYAVPADPAVLRLLRPHDGHLPEQRASTIAFRPLAAGRTRIDIRYFWPTGPVIGRLYVDVRAINTVNCRFHLVTLNGSGFGNSFLGQAAPAGVAPAVHRANRITGIVEDVNHVLLPHGIQIANSGIVNTAWTNANFPAAGAPFMRVMRAMAGSPNRANNRVNIFLVDWSAAMASAVPPPFGIGFVALGPPVAWSINIGARWPNNAAGNVGSGIVIDTSAVPFTGSILAHEFGHVFHLCSMNAAGGVRQWHSIGDDNPSRDDIVTRRRMMYPYTTLVPSNDLWRNDVGYGVNMGALLTQRRLAQDSTFEESRRAWSAAGNGAAIYAI